MSSNWKPESAFAKAVYDAGFEYDPTQDIIYSRMHPLQRHFGYAYGYDHYALDVSMNIDCEPIFFEYDKKLWMIELWKGQYGVETGCEVGIYVRDPNDHSFPLGILDNVLGKRPDAYNARYGVFYNCADDNQMLEMSLTLKRKGRELFRRGPEKHWWLTGFKWGVYSEPEDLVVDVTIKFDHSAMQDAFTAALKSMGYTYKREGPHVSFTFDQPKTYQPRLHSPLLQPVRTADQAYVAAYDALNLPNNDPNRMPKEAFAILRDSSLQYEGFYTTLLANLIGDVDVWHSVMAFFHKVDLVDFSVQGTIQNRSTRYTLVVEDYGVFKSKHPSGSDLGRYDQAPTAYIPPGGTGAFLLQDKHGVHGAEGWVRYELVERATSSSTTFSYGCPTGAYSNYVKVEPKAANICFYARSGSHSEKPKNHVPSLGHPLKVRFVVTDH